MDQDVATALAERILVSVQTMDTLHRENEQMDKLLEITVSTGLVSTSQIHSYNLENLISMSTRRFTW
jgi:PleD family two-component response regulator